MKQVFMASLALLLLLGAGSCKQKGCTDVSACNYDPDATKDDGTCNYGCNGGGGNGGGNGGGTGGGTSTGRVTFWNDQSWIGTITVNCGGTSGSITSNTHPSSCSASGCANFSGAPGTYSYSASSTTGESWSGSLTLTSGGCLLFYLHD